MLTLPKSILDTRLDTNKIFVSTNYRFTLRDYIDNDGKSLLYLVVTDSKTKERYNTQIKIEKRFWDSKKQRIKIPKDEILAKKYISLNLIIENIDAKLISIKTHYHLTEQFLDAKTLIDVFQKDTPNIDFISFYKHHLELQNYSKQTYKNHNSVIKKLQEFAPAVPFHKVTAEFLQAYRKYYSKKNTIITYNTDLKCIKTFLRIAEEQGIKLNIKLNKIKVNVNSEKITYLLPYEVALLKKYYFNEFINPDHIIPLGCFLFSCYTGLRISDVKNRTRDEVLQGMFQFTIAKTNKFLTMKLNDEARAIVEHQSILFTTTIVEQTINKKLKNIAQLCKIDKLLTTHVARHTFATRHYRINKDILTLQSLLGHSNIRHTMRYVHLVDEEKLSSLDKLSY